MNNRYLLGFDVGSSSVKASLVNADSGKCVASAFFPKTEAPIIAVKQDGQNKNPKCGGNTPNKAFNRFYTIRKPKPKTYKPLASLIRCTAWFVWTDN